MPGKHRRASPRRQRNAVTVTGAALAAGGLLAGTSSVAVHVNWHTVAGCNSGMNMASDTVTTVQGAGHVLLSTWQSRQQGVAMAQPVMATSGTDTGSGCGRHASNSAPGRHLASSPPRHAAPQIATDSDVLGGRRSENSDEEVSPDPHMLIADEGLKVPHAGTAPGKTRVAAAKAVSIKAASPGASAAASPKAPMKMSSAVRAVSVALAQQGTPYIYGSNAPGGFDCSGLVQWVYKKVGIALPRTAAAQATAGHRISLSQLQPGDLLFFYQPVEHVVIYVGNGKIVEASQPGQPIHVRPLYLNGFVEARRIV